MILSTELAMSFQYHHKWLFKTDRSTKSWVCVCTSHCQSLCYQWCCIMSQFIKQTWIHQTNSIIKSQDEVPNFLMHKMELNKRWDKRWSVAVLSKDLSYTAKEKLSTWGVERTMVSDRNSQKMCSWIRVVEIAYYLCSLHWPCYV